MKRTLGFFCVMFLALSAALYSQENGSETKTLNVLTIGNSFSICLEKALPDAVKSVPGCDIHLESIYIGGCSLERHWNNIVTEEANPADRYFDDFTYKEKIQSREWDFVSIQQNSPNSWRPETYFPFAQQLYDYVHQYAPTAEIVFQQTWSYRADDERMKEWGFSGNEDMFQKVKSSYANAAGKLGIRVIPVGEAIQLARQTQPGGYEQLDRSKWTYPNLPDMSRYFCGNLKWEDENTLEGDSYHLNERGRYLQACVWFAFLFDRPATDITWVPAGISAEDAEFMRKTAQEVIERYKK